ncbi:hypothetical protein TELCIR_01526 [Teladorsagia circumcincta]|uniref:Xylose isomerase-like TIM barrel domain-containing protein n=1 Tax=Teladorsagia circumcincta TaxID=45464 RepID=A0A2G9V3V9_TELCI|nr:hypothetical protein TELCIR_01526 [Teladorsagia circumcincta]
MAGIPPSSEPDLPKVFQDNVAYAAEKFGKADIMCLIEPINHYTVPGYFLSSYEQAKDIIDAVKLPNLKIQYIAQVPSRDEPNTPGEIDYQYVLRQLQAANPNWTIGLEHNFHEAHGSPRDWVQQLGLSM